MAYCVSWCGEEIEAPISKVIYGFECADFKASGAEV